MASINIDLDYFDEPRLLGLSKTLGRAAEGLPVRLWTYTGKFHAETGDITGFSAEVLEERLKWTGRRGELIDALLQWGYIAKTLDGYSVVDWDAVGGHIVAYKVRAKKARASQLRKIQDRGDSDKDSATSQLQAGLKPASSRLDAGPCIPNQTNAKQGGSGENAYPPLFSGDELAQEFARWQRPRCPCRKCALTYMSEWLTSFLKGKGKGTNIIRLIRDSTRNAAEEFFHFSDRLTKPPAKNGLATPADVSEEIGKIVEQSAQRRAEQEQQAESASPLTFAELRALSKNGGTDSNGNASNIGREGIHRRGDSAGET